MKTIFLDTVKDLPPEMPRSRVTKLRNGQQVVVDLKERADAKHKDK
jgi:hypothetical protein